MTRAHDIANEFVAERQRHAEVEGWTDEHDDDHDLGELADAAAVYSMSPAGREKYEADRMAPKKWPPAWWPWQHQWFKPKDRRRDLVRAGSLLIAEIQRIDREKERSERAAPEAISNGSAGATLQTQE